ncbi:MAG TPA: CHASE2 domain-containing protein [bacterium]|nr:CHASE2 domain-containing protein [bacterium]
MKLPFKLPNKTEERNRIVGPIIGLAIAIVFLVLYFSGPLKSFDNYNLDFKFKLRKSLSKPPVNKDFVIVEIDETTLEFEGTFPDDPLYYIDIINALGKDNGHALATVFDLNYSRPFGRKIDPDVKSNFTNVLNQISAIVSQDVQLKTGMIDNLKYYTELLGGPDAASVAGPLAAKLDEVIFSQDLSNSDMQMQQVASFAEQNKDLSALAPDRESAVAAAAGPAKNVYFTYDSKNWIASPYTSKEIKTNPKLKKAFEKYLSYPTSSRPNNPIEGAMYDAYRNFVTSDFDYLLSEKDGTFSKHAVRRMTADRAAKDFEISNFEKQNLKVSWKIPKGLENTFTKLNKIKPVTPIIGEQTVGQGARKAEFSIGDGTMRMIAPVVEYNGRLYPHIDLLLAMRYLGVDKKNVVFNRDSIILKNAVHPKTHKKGDIVIPLLPGGTMLVNWTGVWADTTLFPHLSLRNLYTSINRYRIWQKNDKNLHLKPGEQMVPLEEAEMSVLQTITEKEAKGLKAFVNSFKNKIFIVGLTATGAAETTPTPLEARYKELGLHPNAINTITENLFIRQTSPIFIVLIFLVLGVGFGFAGGAVKHNSAFIVAMINFLIMILTTAAYFVFCSYLFIKMRIDAPLFVPISLVILTFILVFLYRFITEEQEKKKMKGMFSTYVNPQVVETLIKDPDKLKLGGEMTHASVFFSDIAGFTTISETMSPEDLVELLNEYLTAMTDILLGYGGTLDKYIGDAVLGIFGAPIYFEEHAKNCCFCAIDMQKKIAELRVGWKERGKPDIQVRCGVNTGDLIAGNMGSVKRFNYTSMGHAVEFGEHLESGGKTYDTQKTISEFTKAEADEHIITRLLDIAWISGYEKPVKIYELLAKKSDGIPDELEKGIRAHEEAVILFFERKWDESLEKLDEVFKHIPDDKPAKMFRKRVVEAKENPPDAEFDKFLAEATHRQNYVF